jgi:hypothetical protein
VPDRSLDPFADQSLTLSDIPQSEMLLSTVLGNETEEHSDTASDWDDVSDFEGQRDIADDLALAHAAEEERTFIRTDVYDTQVCHNNYQCK